ncbi:hypothetical protein PUN28_002563 [Cardiocondyla obscurior]|uniref:Uncharacterized protein n=1 Tax=Cardiocondyla obscurior TaxID=286306 RepID=A0AAW2GV08_9HYME
MSKGILSCVLRINYTALSAFRSLQNPTRGILLFCIRQNLFLQNIRER